MKYLISTLATILLISVSINSYGQNSKNTEKPEAGKLITEIIKHTGCKPILNTVDVIKEGDPSTRVTGIATCMFATMEVLKQAVSKNCNLIIVHEPTYYSHMDETTTLKNDPVFLEKKHYINDHKLVIWRFHDYIHSMKPDGIIEGMIMKLGWEKFAVKGVPNQFVFPEMTLKEFLKQLKQTFPANAFYVIGNPDMKLSKVGLAVGASGRDSHISLLTEKNVDVLVAGEAQQWETYEYARDAVQQGRNKAVIFLGHINSEEYGMNYCATWLKTFINDVPIYYIEHGSSFWSY